MKRDITISKFLAAFAISLLIFVCGLWLGDFLNRERVQNIDLMQKDYTMNMQGIELQYDILRDRPCSDFNSSQLTFDLYQIGTRLTYLESKLGPKNFQVKSLKENYHLLSLRHWLFMKEYSQSCNKTFDSLLYFYADSDVCPDCEDQGNILTFIHREYSVFNIYSFDANINNPAIQVLKDLYGVKQVPSIVFDEKTFTGFQSKKKVLEIIYDLINESKGDEKLNLMN